MYYFVYVAKDFTILMLPKISVAREFASASLSWYYFLSRLRILTINRRMIEMIGVAITMQRVSGQLMTQRKMMLPMSWMRFLRNTEMLSLAALWTTPISLVNLDTNYPDL